MIGGVVAGLALAAWVTVGPTVIVTEHVPLATIVDGERPALRGLLEESEVALVNCRTRSDRYGARQINRTAYLLAAASGLRLPTRPIESPVRVNRSEEHTSELQSQSHISYAVFCLKKKNGGRTGWSRSHRSPACR